MMRSTGYVEHVAIHVTAFEPHLTFFREVLGMDVRDRSGPDPEQIWLQGGVQLIRDPDFVPTDGRFAHLGVMVDDLDAAIAAATRHSVATLAKGPNWLALPDGLVVELLQASGDSVARARDINPRA